MHVSIMRAAAVAAASCVLAGGLSACDAGRDAAGKEDRRTPVQVLRAASAAMAKAGSAAFTLDIRGPLDSRRTARGVLDWSGRVAMDVTFTSPETPSRVLRVDSALYLGGDDNEAATHGGRHWMRLAGQPVASGAAAMLLGPWVDQAHPSSVLDVAASAGTPRRAGEEKAAGTDTVHYRCTAPVAALVAATRWLSARQRAQALEDYGKQGVSEVTLDFWLNGRDEVVRQVQTVEDGRGAFTTTLTYSELGRHDDVRVPSPSDVYTLEDLAEEVDALPADASGQEGG
ncbi:hypothetical protein [Streptomyces sp. NPDC001380]|uniref:hypothetical protein n=1 Tax=Streptomyces sp. NPDC001380 TaxID=3364566 RepID=UPI0036ADD264